MPKYERQTKEMAKNLKKAEEDVKDQGKIVKEVNDLVRHK